MDHPLLVLGAVEGHLELQLLQRLTEPGHIAVPEDAPHPGEERLLDAVALDVLLGEESHHGLGHGHARRLDPRRHLFPFQTCPRLPGNRPAGPLTRSAISRQDVSPSFISSLQVARTQA